MFYKYIGFLAIISSIVQHILLFCSYCTIILYMGRVYYRGPNATVFSSSVHILTCFIRPGVWEISSLLLSQFHYHYNPWLLITIILYRPSLLCAEFVWAKFVMGRVCDVPSWPNTHISTAFLFVYLMFMVMLSRRRKPNSVWNTWAVDAWRYSKGTWFCTGHGFAHFHDLAGYCCKSYFKRF